MADAPGSGSIAGTHSTITGGGLQDKDTALHIDGPELSRETKRARSAAAISRQPLDVDVSLRVRTKESVQSSSELEVDESCGAATPRDVSLAAIME